MKRILLIEDDHTLSNGIALALKEKDREIVPCTDLKSARIRFSEEYFDLILLDINLPDGNGLDFLQEIRKQSRISVILLTANDLEIDIVTGLELGADDYITKPFSLAILRARVNTQLRKSDELKAAVSEEKEREDCFSQGDLSFDFEKMNFRKAGEPIELSKTEQKLLRILTSNKGTILERGRLVDYVWTDGAEYVDENALSVSIKRLRNKLEENPSKPEYIKTVYGIGYVWEAE